MVEDKEDRCMQKSLTVMPLLCETGVNCASVLGEPKKTLKGGQKGPFLEEIFVKFLEL